MKLSLKRWGALHFDPPPSIRRLRGWARAGLIQPRPVFDGRQYWVEETATLDNPEPPMDPVVEAILRTMRTAPAPKKKR